MKNILKDFFCQCARPEGFLGRCMLRFMNFGHAPLTNWGLTHVAFSDGMTMLDVGCGGGATLKRLLLRSPKGKVYGIDISEESEQGFARQSGVCGARLCRLSALGGSDV